MMDRVPENRVFVEGKFQILGVSYFIIFFKMELVNFDLWKKLGGKRRKSLVKFLFNPFSGRLFGDPTHR